MSHAHKASNAKASELMLWCPMTRAKRRSERAERTYRSVSISADCRPRSSIANRFLLLNASDATYTRLSEEARNPDTDRLVALVLHLAEQLPTRLHQGTGSEGRARRGLLDPGAA
ncbi:MAG: hypothetical protein WA971_14230, partial [Microbacterium sp.]